MSFKQQCTSCRAASQGARPEPPSGIGYAPLLALAGVHTIYQQLIRLLPGPRFAPRAYTHTPPWCGILSASLAGSLHQTHSRVTEFAEEVVFLGGDGVEKMLAERRNAGVVQHESMVLRRSWWFGCVEEGIIKWL